jgi:hypothetical protein
MNQIRRLRSYFLLLAGVSASALWAAETGTPRPAEPASVHGLLQRADLTPYRGWLKFLQFRSEQETARGGAKSEAARKATERLHEWVRRIDEDPAVLGKLRGVQEWAYESPADGSGQPFKLMIPTDYDAAKPAGISLYMHGFTGDHLKHSTGMRDRAGDFEIAVLGRSRGGAYLGLSGADVLHVLEYVQAHWKVDGRRIQLSGGSMGGGGIFKLGSRHPHLFSSGLITCGFTTQEPINNLLTLPLYATHSADDPVVPIITARGPLQTLRARGARNIFDETNGLGHAAWDYAEGNKRASAWGKGEVRPNSHDVLRLDYTALASDARRGWWAEVAEWGPEAKPARFILTATRANSLTAELRNVGRLTLRIDESPFDRSRPLRVSINGKPEIEIQAPLPARVDIDASGLAAAERSARRPHTPGGAYQLYNGEPLLIVYGTHGSANLRKAAEAAARSWNPTWLADDDGSGRDPEDGVPFSHNLYGALRTKADEEVTAEDLARNHLVLIGNAGENSVVKRLSAALPLRITDTEIVCSDGVTFPRKGNAWSLVHHNPEAPDRLIFWVGSDVDAAYAVGSVIPALHGGLHVADLIVADPVKRTVVATRSFAPDWSWTKGTPSPTIAKTLGSAAGLADAIAESVRLAAGCDYAIASTNDTLGDIPFDPATATIRDVANLHYNDLIDVLEMDGSQLQALDAKFKSSNRMPRHPAIQPALAAGTIKAGKTYRIAITAGTAFQAGRVLLDMPVKQERTELNAADAIERFLPGQGN